MTLIPMAFKHVKNTENVTFINVITAAHILLRLQILTSLAVSMKFRHFELNL